MLSVHFKQESVKIVIQILKPCMTQVTKIYHHEMKKKTVKYINRQFVKTALYISNISKAFSKTKFSVMDNGKLFIYQFI